MSKIYINNDDYSTLSTYLKEIDKIPLLSREEEYKLAVAAKNGDTNAREKLICANCRFVVAVAKKYRNNGLSLEDLISEGNIGLINGIDKFQPEKGFHFISYGVWWIRQAILKAISEQSRLIRLPMNKNAQFTQIQKAKIKLEDEGYKATVEEIAKECNLSQDDVKNLLSYSKTVCSLDTPISTEDDSSLGDFIESTTDKPEEQIMQAAVKDQVDRILLTFSERERKILTLRYGLKNNKPLSLKQVGDILNLTKERIRQIEKKALTSLSLNSEVQDMRCFI